MLPLIRAPYSSFRCDSVNHFSTNITSAWLRFEYSVEPCEHYTVVLRYFTIISKSMLPPRNSISGGIWTKKKFRGGWGTAYWWLETATKLQNEFILGKTTDLKMTDPTTIKKNIIEMRVQQLNSHRWKLFQSEVSNILCFFAMFYERHMALWCPITEREANGDLGMTAIWIFSRAQWTFW